MFEGQTSCNPSRAIQLAFVQTAREAAAARSASAGQRPTLG